MSKRLVLIFLICLTYIKSEKIVGSAYLDHNTLELKLTKGHIHKNSIADIYYEPNLEKEGWDKLTIITTNNLEISDLLKVKAAGFLEGYYTYKRISNHYKNMFESTWGKNGTIPDNVKEFFEGNKNFIKNKIIENPKDDYWNMIGLVQAQYEALVEGFNLAAKKNNIPQINEIDFHTMTSFGDLFDIVYYKNKTIRPDFINMPKDQLIKFIHSNNHCSALIKIAPDFSDIWFGHNSWFNYSATTRIFKEYKFFLNNPLQVSKSVTFSSYAGTLGSNDDFYVTGQNLVVMETTNSFFNTDLYDYLTPNSLLTWQRAVLSNWISSDSKTWTDNFSKYNSGTYNNQYMVLDLKKVDIIKRKLNDNAFWVIEQIPNKTQTGDMTDILSFGYWGSFNTPYFREIRELSLIEEQIQRHSDLVHTLDYNTCARSEIFRRDQGKINSIEDFKKIMRSNNYKTDILSLNDPALVISSRFDLLNEPMCGGAYDAKVASIHDIIDQENKKIHIVGGPTFNDQVPEFIWDNVDVCKNQPKYGLPEKLAFEWTVFQNNDKRKGIEILKFLQ